MVIARFFLVFLVCLLFAGGCDEDGVIESGPVALECDAAVIKTLPAQIIMDYPGVVVRDNQSKYPMQVVKPRPGVDYKIAKVAADPGVDYKIIVVDPNSGEKSAR